MKGLTLHVYRSAGPDCTAGGISATHDQLTLIGLEDVGGTFHPMPGNAHIFEATPERPAVVIKVRYIGSPILSVVPAKEDAIQGHVADPRTMAGGNYAACCDSRVGEFVRRHTGLDFYGAYAIHDRMEF